MRPAGEIRQAALAAAKELMRAQPGRRGVTWRDVASHLIPVGVGREAVRHTVKNLARCGALQCVDQVRVAGSMRPLHLYAPALGDAQRSLCTQPLPDVFRAWTR